MPKISKYKINFLFSCISDQKEAKIVYLVQVCVIWLCTLFLYFDP